MFRYNTSTDDMNMSFESVSKYILCVCYTVYALEMYYSRYTVEYA